MALTNDQITAQNFKDFYDQIRPYLNGGITPTTNGGTGNADGYIRTGKKANTNVGTCATIEGYNNEASANYTHAEGYSTKATVQNAHAEGSSTTASGNGAHAEGYSTTASAQGAHSEGQSNTASGAASHAEGMSNTASARSTHAQGESCTASASYASAGGHGVTAGYESQFCVGKYNSNKSTSIFEVGIGTGTNARSNGLELDSSGNLKVAGTITDGNGNVLNKYLETTVTLSTSAQTTATFTDAVFTTTTCVDVAVSEWGLVPDDVTVTTGSCTVTFPSVDTARTVSVRVYVR